MSGGWGKLGVTWVDAGWRVPGGSQESREVLMLKEAGRVAVMAIGLVTKLEAKAEGLVDVR